MRQTVSHPFHRTWLILCRRPFAQYRLLSVGARVERLPDTRDFNHWSCILLNAGDNTSSSITSRAISLPQQVQPCKNCCLISCFRSGIGFPMVFTCLRRFTAPVCQPSQPGQPMKIPASLMKGRGANYPHGLYPRKDPSRRRHLVRGWPVFRHEYNRAVFWSWHVEPKRR